MLIKKNRVDLYLLGIFFNNTYKEPSRLHLGDGTFIYSNEGTIQGDPLAMAMYAVSTRPTIDSLSSEIDDVAQVWFADDSSGAGKLLALKASYAHKIEICFAKVNLSCNQRIQKKSGERQRRTFRRHFIQPHS